MSSGPLQILFLAYHFPPSGGGGAQRSTKFVRYLRWDAPADLIVKGINGAISAKTVTYDFERQMEGATLLKCSEFGDAIIAAM